jgi:hypothetical protein
MMRLATGAVLLAACGSAGKPDPVVSTAAAMHWLSLDHFGVEVEAPSCDHIVQVPQMTALNVMPADDACMPRGLAVFSDESPEEPATLEALRALVDAGQKPPIIRYGTTPTGWFVEQQLGRDIYYTQHYVIADRRFTCLTSFLVADPDAEALRHICTSARPRAST